MSQTEYHSGKLRKIEKTIPLEEFCEELCNLSGINERAFYNKTWVEEVQDSLSDKYFIYNGEIYEFLEHTKVHDEWQEIKLTKTKDGTFQYFGSFYNGGTCLEECLGSAFENFKDEDEQV